MALFRRRFDQDYYDSFWYRSHPGSVRNRMRLELVLRHKEGGRLLDIGIGAGDFFRRAARRFDAWAMDVSPHAASRLPAELRGRIALGDVETADIPAPQYDVITAFNILEHLRRPAAVIRKVRAALAPGGVFIGSVPSNTHCVGSIHTAITNYFDKTHRSTYRVQTWRKAFQRAGLQDTRLFGEIMLDGGLCLYVTSPIWPHISLNMMFVARAAAS